MKLVVRPQEFDVVVLTNLQGNIVSDLPDWWQAGIRAVHEESGDHISIFEAVHGTAPDIARKTSQIRHSSAQWNCHVTSSRIYEERGGN